MDVNELIDKSICFDEVYRKKQFLLLLDEFPQIREEIEILMKKEKNIEWVLRAEEEDVYFIFDDERWKRKKICNKAYVQLLFVGHEHFPVIKIFIF